jgi:hypothetical protein
MRKPATKKAERKRIMEGKEKEWKGWDRREKKVTKRKMLQKEGKSNSGRVTDCE